MADQNAWMRAGEPSLDPPDEDGRRCHACDAVLQDGPAGEHCDTPDCDYAPADPDDSLEDS